MDLRAAFRELPVQDLIALIRKLPPGSCLAREELGAWADWDAHKENTARLLEIESYKLQLSWVDRITDPEDPEVKRERAQAKRAGVTPPRDPMVPPIAMRPGDISEQRLQEYLDRLAEHQASSSPKSIQAGSRAAFDQAWGLET